jgi:tetratricopeptide (TPR) repeat protein
LALQVDLPAALPESDVERWIRLLPEASPRSDTTRKLLADASDGKLEDFSLLQAALIAGGLDETALLSAYQARIERWSEELHRRGSVVGDAKAKAAVVFRFLHDEILIGQYQREATDLALTFRDGRFNCVSSLVLFMSLAERYGLDVRAVELPGHVFCRLRTADEVLDVETTCKAWFDENAGTRTRSASVATETPLVSSPALRARIDVEPREIAPTQLLAIIFYNRGVELLARQEYLAAVSVNLAAYRLDPISETVRGNLLAAVNNWALALTRSGRHAAAIDLLSRGLEAAPHYEFFQQNDVYVHQQWIGELCGQGRHRQALQVLDAAQHRRPGVRYLDVAQQEQLEQAAAGVGRENPHSR